MSRAVDARVDNRAGEEGCFVGSERGCGFSEVHARGGLGTVDSIPPFDDVEIELEDAPLRQRGFQPSSDQQLPQLADGAASRRKVQVLRELLSNRTATADGAAARHVF